MWVTRVVTNDPAVATNPERNTFYGFHANPGYDDWYGFFYGDFRGRPDDASGWVKLLHEDFPHHYHWNFSDNGWAVHGHVKQYIAYYNWTFGGQCGLGSRGNAAPPPYMADQYGYPVVDVYVDSVPPYPPQPYVAKATPSSLSFTWDAVADRGDGSGADYFAAGMDHYLSWLTLGSASAPVQLASTATPRELEVAGLNQAENVCVHVQAFDRLQNATPVQTTCAQALAPPPISSPPIVVPRVEADPGAPGLVGLDTWLWLDPAPASTTWSESYGGVDYMLVAKPAGVTWSFGDGSAMNVSGTSGYGRPYPTPSPVDHVYQAHSEAGYLVGASVQFDVTWSAVVGARSYGPYPLGTAAVRASPLTYPVQQAQPELVEA